MDDAEGIDFALNSDFDSALLDCWDEAAKNEGEEQTTGSPSNSVTSSLVDKGSKWDAHNLGGFPSFSAEEESMYQKPMPFIAPPELSLIPGPLSTGSGSGGDGSGSIPPAAVSTDVSSINTNRDAKTTSSSTTGVSASVSSEAQTIPQHQQQQPQESETVMPVNPMQLHPLGIQSSASCPPYGALANLPASTHMDSATTQNLSNLLPLALNALQASGLNLAHIVPQASMPAINVPATGTDNLKPPSEQQAPMRQEQQIPAQQQQQQQQQQQSSSTGNKTSQQVPPFLLFDAPVELRANFINAQRAHGFPILQDNNSFHFGMAVNGFHPQGVPGGPAKKQIQNVKLIDGRHGDQGTKRLKNVKEQKRAQRITSLIEELRVKMEKGGWKVGMKSKLHTLSSCADYVKHLVKVNKKKEEALQKARCDLEAKRRKLEEEKAQQDPSDPESTTSSLTVSSDSATSKVAAKSNVVSSDSDKASSAKKRAATSCSKEGAERKKPRLTSHESSVSSTLSSGGDDSARKGPGEQALSIDPTVSTVSELTDSNKESSFNSGSDTTQSRKTRSSSARGDKTTSSTSVSSDAAVASGKEDASEYDTNHADLVIQGRKRKRRSEEATSLDSNFELDYEEVFLQSNVPQILASTSGRIIAWNDFFLKTTGLSDEEVDRITIFSLVQTEKLSDLFGIVAASLRQSHPSDKTDDKKSNEVGDEASETTSQSLKDYATITLPCVNFQPRQEDDSETSKPLNMTVTLMDDEDPRKRCFHCVFTDCPGTKGLLGSITPELLGMMFTNPCAGTDNKGNSGDAKPAAGKT